MPDYSNRQDRQAFFSYTHTDAADNPDLVKTLTLRLNSAVNRKLAKITFTVYKDERLLAGDLFDEILNAEAALSDFFIILLSPTWFDRPFCAKEFASYKATGKNNIIPIVFQSIDKRLIDAFSRDQRAIYDDVMTHHLTNFESLFFFQASRAEREKVIESVAEKIVDVILSTVPPAASSSHGGNLAEGRVLPGISAFDEGQEDLLYGRNDEAAATAQRLDQNGFAGVVGASGTGKTSLLQAKVAPAWKRRHAGLNAHTLTIRPGSDPFLALAAQLELQALDQHVVLFSEKPLPAMDACLAYCRQLNIGRLLIIVEQFEEIFRIETQQRNKFIAELVAIIREQGELQRRSRNVLAFAISIRADTFHDALNNPDLCSILQAGIILLAEPDEEKLIAIVNAIQDKLGLQIDTNLKRDLIGSVASASSGRLALLGFTLRALFDERVGGRLDGDVYKRLGGAAEAIATRAGEAFSSFESTTDKDALLKRLFAELVQKTGDGPPLRRRAVLSALTNDKPDMGRLIATFCRPDVGLLTKSGDLIEVSHEIVFTRFERFSEWIASNTEQLAMAATVEKAAREWSVNRRGSDGLWSPSRATAATAVIKESPELWERLAPEAKDFLDPATFTDALIAELEVEKTRDDRREQIGRDLDRLQGGDPRPGIGVCPDGCPDIQWLPIAANPRLSLKTERDAPYVGAVAAFLMAKYPVTRAQYRGFRATGYADATWWNGRPPPAPASDDEGAGNEPVTEVTWAEAMAFARWADARCSGDHVQGGRREGWRVRLPTEWEWLQAATGGSGARYPWGERVVPGCARSPRRDLGRVAGTSVALFPRGQSPSSIADLVGNVQEVCLNLFEPTDPRDGAARDYHPLRGGVIDATRDDGQGTCQCRASLFRREPSMTVGFRLVYGPGDPETLARRTVQDWARGLCEEGRR